MSENNSAQNNASGQNSKILLAVCGVVIAVLVGVVAVLLNRPDPAQVPAQTSQEDAAPRRAVLVTEDNVQEAIVEVSRPVTAPTSYRVKMSATWTFNDGASASNDAYVENAQTNETPVYFDLILNDSGETVLESPVIPIGASMRDIKLDKALEAGTYPAVMVYHLLDENQNTLSTVRMGVTLVIEN
jgi:hypothetical protein